jgi:hypothetical protein
MTRIALKRGTLALAALLAVVPLQAQKDKDKGNAVANSGGNKAQDRLTREVRHELVMLPYYGVFDNLL